MPKLSAPTHPATPTLEHLLTTDPLALLLPSPTPHPTSPPAAAPPPTTPPPHPLLPALLALAPLPTTGLHLYAHLRDAVRILPSGCDPLDALLRGGLREGLLTELAGESASGKTQLAHLAAAVTAHRGERVLYFDTTNSFSPARIATLHTHLAAAAAAPAPDPSEPPPPNLPLPATLANITLLAPRSYYQLARQLDELGEQLAAVADAAARPSLLIVDSLSAVLSPVLGSRQHNQGHALAACLGRQLRALADTYTLAVLVTNHVVSAGQAASGATRPAMGEHWKAQPHVRVMVLRGGAGRGEWGPDVRCLQLASSTFSEAGQQAWCRLCDAGAVPLQAEQ